MQCRIDSEMIFFLPTDIIWYELLIMAINIFKSTIILMTEYEPNISIAQKRVKLLMPCNSNAIKSTRPNDAQNKDWDVSNKLQKKRQNDKDTNKKNMIDDCVCVCECTKIKSIGLLSKTSPNAAGFFIVIKIWNVRIEEMIAFILLQISIVPKQLI